MKTLSIKKGFTIVETLVAVTILMITIAGPLTVANKAYTAALDARNQTEAYNIAQEILEYVNGQKDNNIWPPFVFGTNETHEWLSPYTIVISFAAVPGNGDLALATVTVSWKFGSTVNSIQLQQILSNSNKYPR